MRKLTLSLLTLAILASTSLVAVSCNPPAHENPDQVHFGEFFAPFFMDEEDWKNWTYHQNLLLNWFHSISMAIAGLQLDCTDIRADGAAVFDMSRGAVVTAFKFTVYPVGKVVDGMLTVASAGAGDVPEGELAVLVMELDGDVPLNDPDHFYTYAAVFDSDGDPANNFQYMEPYDWDYFQGTDLWYQLDWNPDLGEWQLYVTKTDTKKQVTSSARAVIDDNLIVFFIPVGEFDISRPDYRLTAFGHDGTYTPEASGGDVTGDDPTKPLRELPQQAIQVDEVQDTSATD